MGVKDLKTVWQTVDVLAVSRADNGLPMLQVGDALHGVVFDNQVPLFQQPGLICFPASPDQNQGATQVVLLNDSASGLAFAGRDARSAKIAGQLGYGEACLYAPAGQARILLKKDGSITAYTTDNNKEDGQSVLLSVGPTGLKIGTPFGALTITSDGAQFASKSGAFVVCDASGNLTLGGGQVSIAGGSVQLGSSGSDPVVTLSKLLLYLNAHVHTGVTTGGGVSGPPGTPATPAIASTSVFSQ